MDDINEEYYSINNIINFINYFYNYLLSKWRLLILVTLVGAALGLGYYFMQKPKYEAITTFILEEKATGGGGLAGLASQFGFDLGSISGGGSIFAGDNILDILQSRQIIQKVLLSKVENNSTDKGTLADLFLDCYGWKKNWSKVEELKDINYATVDGEHALSLKQDSVLNLIHEFLIKKSLYADRLNKKGTIIKVQVNSINSLFAKLMTDRLVDEASKLYLQVKTGTAQANINRMQRRSDSLLALLNNKSFKVAATQLLDVNPGIKTASVPVEIASRDKSVIAALYTEVTKNLEASKMLLSQQTPVIQVLDKPHFPLVLQKKGKLSLIVLGMFTSLAFLIMALGVKFLIKIGDK